MISQYTDISLHTYCIPVAKLSLKFHENTLISDKYVVSRRERVCWIQFYSEKNKQTKTVLAASIMPVHI